MPLAPGCCLSAWHALSPHLALQYAWGFWQAYRASPRWITNGGVFVKHTAATFPPSSDAAVSDCFRKQIGWNSGPQNHEWALLRFFGNFDFRPILQIEIIAIGQQRARAEGSKIQIQPTSSVMLFQMWKSHTQTQERGCKSNPLFPETTSASSSLQKIKKNNWVALHHLQRHQLRRIRGSNYPWTKRSPRGH